MDFDFFREFIVITESKNFADAADKLAVSTSALSRHLNAAEAELGALLFTRTSRGVTLNPYGEMFLEYAKNMVKQQESFLSALQSRMDEASHTVVLSSNYQINYLISSFRRKYPQYTINRVRNGRSSVENLRNGLCDLAFSINEHHAMVSDVEYSTFAQDRHVVALHAGHPLADRESIPLSALKDYPFIALVAHGTNEPMNMDLFEAAGFRPHFALSVTTGEEGLALVEQGHGAIIILERPARQAPLPSVRLVGIDGVTSQTVCICRRKGVKLPQGAEALWRFACDLNK